MKKDGLAVEGEGVLVQKRQVSPITAWNRPGSDFFQETGFLPILEKVMRPEGRFRWTSFGTRSSDLVHFSSLIPPASIGHPSPLHSDAVV